MKSIEYCRYQNTDLMVLIEENDNKATATYFVNGKEQTEWSKIRPDFQDLLTAMFERFCKDYGLTKWSY